MCIVLHTLFYFIFFCQRGRENLYDMEQDWFKVCVNPDGTKYVTQVKEELDKNHGIQDTDPSNQARMSQNKGNFNQFLYTLNK